MGGLSREVEGYASIKTLLGDGARNKEALAGGFESPVESSEELEGTLSEELSLSLWGDVGMNFDTGDDDVGHGNDDGGGQWMTVVVVRGGRGGGPD